MLVLDDVHIAALARVPERLASWSCTPRTRCGSCSAPARTRRSRCTSCASAAAWSRSAPPTSRSPRPRPRRCSPRTASTSPPSWSRRCARAPRAGAPACGSRRYSLQGRDDPERFVAEFAGDDRVVGDYLLAEVLDRQPPRLRAFLLRTSIVDRVCGDLADALTGQEFDAGTCSPSSSAPTGSSWAWTRRREWFRYHLLFAKLLRTRAERELGDELPRLHDRAARWYAARGHGSRRSSTRSRRASGTSRSSSSPSTGSTCSCAAQGSAIRTLRRACCPPERSSGDAELAAALACAALRRRRHRGRRERHLEHAEQAPVPDAAERRRATWRRWRSPACATARLEGDFEAALQAADELLAEAAAARRRSDDAREALVHAMLGGDGAVGAPPRPRRRGARAGGRAGPRAAGWTTSRCRR